MAEHTTAAFAPIPRAAAEALAETRAVHASADFSGRTVLRTSSYVGVVRADDIELRVQPKLGVHRLLWLLGYTHDPRGWRDQDIVQVDDSDQLLPTMAVSFLAATKRALAAGLLQGYRVTEEARPLLRGRLREADQIRQRLGFAVPLEIRYDDYTVDIAENQLLLSAALRLLRLPGLASRTQAGLRHLTALMSEVTPLVVGTAPPATRQDNLTRRYQPALRLARLILDDRSIDQPPGRTQASGYLFNLNTVFQNWLTAALQHALVPHGGTLHRELPRHLDEARQIHLKPDLVWTVAGRPAAVLDAKYKALNGPAGPNADLYQMLAYCTAFGLPTGHLVYAKGDTNPTTHIVRQTSTTIVIWALDLNKPTAHILNQLKTLATTIAGARHP